jgi:hypothetical protein
MLTSDDLSKIAELLKQLETRFDEKLQKQKYEIITLLDEKLEKQTKQILEGVADFVSDALIPLLDKHQKRLEHLEAHTEHPPGQAANT